MNRTDYKTPKELGITSGEYSALASLADRLELNQVSDFNMTDWRTCIGGQIGLGFLYHRTLGDGHEYYSRPLDSLFLPRVYVGGDQWKAAQAIHQFLCGRVTNPWGVS